jgi:hypothetical protein
MIGLLWFAVIEALSLFNIKTQRCEPWLTVLKECGDGIEN